MGKLIVIEGTDCSGKETQSNLLLERLKKEGKKVIKFSFPNYDSPTGKIVGGPYLGKESISKSWFPNSVMLDPKIASLYYAADRKYNINEINKYLNDDYIVIADRYVPSNMAHQASKLKTDKERLEMFKWLEKLEYELLELPKPDLVIILHMPTDKAKELKKNRSEVDVHEKDEKYLEESLKTYMLLAKTYNYKVIDCVCNDKIKSIEEINDELYNLLCI